MNFSDNFFKRVEKKTNVGKDTILELAGKLQKSDLKNEGTLREVIQELGKLTGKEVSKEKEDKIISAVVNDQEPYNKKRNTNLSPVVERNFRVIPDMEI